jgi:adenylate cyclase
LTGRVKIINENIVIGVELMRVSDAAHLWGRQFNQPFSDIFVIQETIAHSISEKLRYQISSIAKRSAQGQIPQDVKAYTQYLKGRHFWMKKNIDDTNIAIKYFQESISTEPSYIASYIGLADCYISLYQLEHYSREKTLSLVSTILNQILRFDKNSPDTLAIIGYTKLLLEWDWENAEIYYQRSLALNPNNSIVRFRFANLLALRGELAESLIQHHQALLFDPLSIIINTSMGRVFYFMEQFDNAITILHEALELDPQNYLTKLILGLALAERERYVEALDIFHSAQNSRETTEILSLIGYVQALAGHKDEAYKAITQIEHQATIKDIDSNNLAYIYIALGETERAFEYLEKSASQHCVDLLGIRVDPRLKPIRQDPRFRDLVRRIGLAES